MSADSLAPLIITLPIGGACALLALGRLLPRAAIDSIALAAAVAVTALAVLLVRATGGGAVVTWAGGWRPAPGATVGIVLVADRLSAVLVLLITGLTTVALLFGWHYFDNLRAHYPALVLLFTAGMTGFALTGDLFDMFVFFELMSVAAYALTGMEVEDPESVQGGLNFGVINSLGAYLCLFGIGLLYAHTGQLGLPQLGVALAGQHRDLLALIAFGLIATGWLVKAAAAPFHFWLADAHAVAPAPVCVLFSGVMAPLGVYGLARIYWSAFDVVLPRPGVHRMIMVLAVATALLGTVMCLLQRHIKRLLAYSTIAHIGLFLLGVGSLSAAGVASATLYLAGHAAVKGALFLLAGILLSHYSSLDEHRLYHRGSRHRVLGALFVLAALLLAGLPISGAGLGKALLEESAGSMWSIALVVLVSALTGGAVLRAGLRIYFGSGAKPSAQSAADETTGAHEHPDTETPRGRVPATMFASICALLLVALALGFPSALTTAIGSAATEFTEPTGYRAAALLGTTPATAAGTHIEWSTGGVLLGGLSTVLAVLVAALALYGRKLLPDTPARLSAVIGALHRAHSGHLGDYAAWLLFGAAAVTGLLMTG
ncbi:complex I subunit 5 family protein [Nocardia arthritidis]|uniref:NADH-quinone oxidoreductase subunit D n=1 Tax=Nocardia arthritidis TaxID=228602 RepID=A0A6G9YMP9_9NOCA|nr:complex I subunit 5 family protein [Nocardia arthritidis]QIS14410.1 NADH-quinone oxidoreductase subunit D [Nocardia arthritidis]